MTLGPWTYPQERYYYDWWGLPHPSRPSDGEIKSTVVDRLRTNPHTKDDDIKVDVKQGVVILGGTMSSWVGKRAAGDDAWDTPGVVDVSNQLTVPGPAADSPAAEDVSAEAALREEPPEVPRVPLGSVLRPPPA